MKKISKFFAGIIVVAMTLMACGGSGIISTPEQAGNNTPDAETTSKEKGLQIAIVSSPSGVDDGNFNEDIYKGVEAFIHSHTESEVTPIRETSGDEEAAIETVSDIAADYDVIVCCGFQFSGIVPIANDYPHKYFILVDGLPIDESGKVTEQNNIYAMEFKDQESGFLAGMAAALESKTKKVAVVNGMPFPSNVNYQYGFESGVNYANEKYFMGVECIVLNAYSGIDTRGVNVGGNYIGSFSDREKAKVIGKELLAKGCDIIFVAAGNAGMGVFDAVKEDKNSKRLKVIGCDADQYNDGENGNDNIVLTSALKVMHTNVQKQLENILEGKFKGVNAVLGADSDSTGYVKEKGRNKLTPYAMAKMDEVYKLIKEGKVVPAANFNGMTPDDFKGLDNYNKQG